MIPHGNSGWRTLVMDGHECTVCGWRETGANDPELHARHVDHLLVLAQATTETHDGRCGHCGDHIADGAGRDHQITLVDRQRELLTPEREALAAERELQRQAAEQAEAVAEDCGA